MNKLILIGNGFDLAHGLKTRYSDFLVWYLNKAIGLLEINPVYEDKLISLTKNTRRMCNDLESMDKFVGFMKFYEINYRPKNDFIKNIIDQAIQNRWVDIENQYYLALIEIYKIFERGEDKKFPTDIHLNELNESFDLIKDKLIEYLSNLKYNSEIPNRDISIHFNRLLNESNRYNHDDFYFFLNFNYTSTIELYKGIFPYDKQFQVNYIHGKLGDKNNPIIFGYGDEKHSLFEKIESLNKNEFLKYIKSTHYLKTQNYQNFSRYIDSAPFEVYIMGHSCGLSDRILLNSIFEHEYCKSIKIYYYHKSQNDDDFMEKIQEISRHFIKDRHRMRNIIVNYQDCSPLTTFKLKEENVLSNN
jgi:hypothetical protein